MTSAADIAASLEDRFAPLGDVRAKAMFGGFGLFADGVMFALVTKDGTPYLRADDTTASRFLDRGSSKHRPMPYWSIPAEVLDDDAALLEWAEQALDVARTHSK